MNSTSTTRKPDLRELHQILLELEALEQLYQTNKIVAYRPLKRVDGQDFHADQLQAVRLVLGSNRSGKSVAGCAEAIAHSLGYRPWLPEDDPNRTVRLTNGDPIPVPNIGRVLAQNFEQAIRQTIWPKFEEWAPRHLIKSVKYSARGVPIMLEWTNGSKIYFMSNDQEDMAFEGTNGHWAWIDEPCDYNKYIGLKRGLVDFDGHLWLTMTPLAQPWIADVIMDRANIPGSGVKAYKFSIWDNCDENGGYMTRAAINEFLSDLREEQLEARLHGNFLHLAGRVYKEWTAAPPYWIDPFDIPLSWPRVRLIDPHPRKPICVLWLAVSPDNQIFAYRALADRRLKTVKDVADRIKEYEGWAGRPRPTDLSEPVVYSIIDYSAREDERTSGTHIQRAFADEGIICALSQKRNAQAGYDAIHNALKRGQYEWDEPMLVTFNTCLPVKRNFERFCYDEWQTGKQRDLKGEKDQYRAVDDDFIDLLRYYYQSGLNYHMLRGHMRQWQRESHDERHIGRLRLPELERFRRHG